MFVRVRHHKLKKGGTSSFAYLVENQWNPIRHKNEQKVIACLGDKTKIYGKGTIEKMILALDRFARHEGFTSLSQGLIIESITDEKILSAVYDFGEYQLVNHVLSRLFLDHIIKEVYLSVKDKKISQEKLLSSLTASLSFNLHPYLPHSEAAINSWYNDKLFSKDKVPLTKDDFYRTLDVIIDNKDKIEREYFNRNTDLFTGGLDFILFDTTSVYYYDGDERVTNRVADPNTHVKADLLQYGYSKDGKPNLKQIIVGSLMSQTGVPLAHETFPGNTSDQVSFPEVIKKVKSKYKLDRLIFAADRGMVNEKNLTLLEEENLEYILGVKIKKLSPVLKSSLLPVDKDQMEKVTDNLFITDFALSSLTVKEQDELIDALYEDLDKKVNSNKIREEIRARILNRRMIIAFNPQMAGIEKENRKYFTDIIKHKLKDKTKKSWFVKNGYSKYIKVERLDISLNEEKLKGEEMYDGVWILITNCGETITSVSLASAYKSLQFIEQGFRDLKSMINIRPIYHFTEKRIKAHIFLSWLTLVVKWYVLNQINSVSHTDGLRFIEKILNLKAIEVDKSLGLYVRTTIDEKTIEQMKILKMIIPYKVIADNRIKTNPPQTKAGRPKKSPPNQLKLLS